MTLLQPIAERPVPVSSPSRIHISADVPQLQPFITIMSTILLPSQVIPAILRELLSTTLTWDLTLQAHTVPALVVSDAALSGYHLNTQQMEYVEKEEKYQH